MLEKITIQNIFVSYRRKTELGEAWEFPNSLEFQRSLRKAPIELILAIHINYSVDDGQTIIVKLEKVGVSEIWSVKKKDMDTNEVIVYFSFGCKDDRMLIDEFEIQLRNKLFPPPNPDIEAKLSWP